MKLIVELKFPEFIIGYYTKHPDKYKGEGVTRVLNEYIRLLNDMGDPPGVIFLSQTWKTL